MDNQKKNVYQFKTHPKNKNQTIKPNIKKKEKSKKKKTKQTIAKQRKTYKETKI